MLGIIETVASNRAVYTAANCPIRFWRMDASPIIDIATKLKAVYERIQPVETDPMLNFDEWDVIAHVELAGFREIHLDLKVDVKPQQHV